MAEKIKAVPRDLSEDSKAKIQDILGTGNNVIEIDLNNAHIWMSRNGSLKKWFYNIALADRKELNFFQIPSELFNNRLPVDMPNPNGATYSIVPKLDKNGEINGIYLFKDFKL